MKNHSLLESGFDLRSRFDTPNLILWDGREIMPEEMGQGWR
jgi:hypothetical protein